MHPPDCVQTVSIFRMSTTEEEALSMMVMITGCTAEQAHAFLQATNGNVEMAVNDFFLSQEAGGGAPGAQGGPADEEYDDGEEDDDDGSENDEYMEDMPSMFPMQQSRYE